MPITRKAVAVAAPVRPAAVATTSLVKADYAGLPAIVRQPGQLIPGFGNLDEGDVTVAYLKILQGMSPETKPDGGSHPQGKFYQSSAGKTIGTELGIVPLHVDKWVELWDSHEGQGGLLARSKDCIHWDKPHTKFTITINNQQRVVDTKGSVKESGLNEFGSSDPSNPRSKPIAPTVYRYSLYLEDWPQLGTSLYIVKGTATKPALSFNQRVKIREISGTPFYAQRFILRVAEAGAGKITWFVPSFENNGDVTDRRLLEDLNARVQMLNAASTVVAVDEDKAAKDEYVGVDRSKNSTY
jgi:hypothetical protein